MTAVPVLWTTREWAEAVASLPAAPPLPSRTVLVPRERVAHGLRREILRLGRPDALAGTRFITPVAAAAAVLRAARVEFTPGEEAARPARLLALFRGGLALDRFSPELVRSSPGWDEAFARTISDLEVAGLDADDLAGPGASGVPGDAAPGAQARCDGDPGLADVARVWRALDAAAGTSWTTARILREASRTLGARPDLWPLPGPVFACVGGETTTAEARFVQTIPRLTLAVLAGRPLRPAYVERLRRLLGQPAVDALLASMAPRAAATERDLLAAYLFEPPAVLADPGRPRSTGPDGTVDLEDHAGVEAELEATADWVVRQVLDGIALEEIAVLLPSLDPLAGLVAGRLERLPWHEGTLPVHVAGGLPLAGAAGGARALALVRALRAHLHGDALAELLPALRTEGGDGRHLSRGAAMSLVWSLGTVGGSPAHPAGALDWASRIAGREGAIAAQLERAREAGDEAEQAGLARDQRELERLLADLRAARPALQALTDLARLVLEGRPLAALWPAMREFIASWLLQPGGGPRVHAVLDERLASVVAAAGEGLTGDDALRLIERTLLGVRLPAGRSGDPAVHVGTIQEARGLPFRAVRIIGLAEGHLPSLPREDPVVPDRQRVALGGPDLPPPPTAADRALETLHALDGVIRDAGERVALSVPRVDIERSLREPGSIVLEAAAALARPHAVTGAPGAVIPDGRALARDAFMPARREARRCRDQWPVSETAWQDAVARGEAATPGSWHERPELDPGLVVALEQTDAATPLDGILGAQAGGLVIPGLTAERPISVSSLRTLLECPHRFLLGTLLRFEEPAAAPARGEIGQPAYGALVHAIAEEFSRQHGSSFGARLDTLHEWVARATAIADQVFAGFLEQYPLTGDGVRQKERERVRADVRDLVEHDWAGSRRFVAVERAFGQPVPVPLLAGRRVLHVRGRIDRVDVDGDLTLVRDLKTGRAHHRSGRESDPHPALDLQLAVYGLVARRLAAEWGLPERVGVAYVYVGRGVEERQYLGDFDTRLVPAAREWLALAADLLAAGAFPRTPVPADCEWCAFAPVCGERVYPRARRLLGAGQDPLGRFAALKGIAPEAPRCP
jgi:RecB family exonuclease